MEDTLRSYTVDASKAAFLEDKLGIIKKGLLADFVVIDTNLLTITDPEDIKKASIIKTVVGGNIVYNK